jgi:osmotically-inducible protein OsmY
MRTVRLEEDSSHHTLLWVLAGTALGVVAGILVAERASGRKVTLRGLVERGRRLAAFAMSRGEELADAATQLREAWGAEGDAEDELEQEWDDDATEASGAGEGPEDEDEMVEELAHDDEGEGDAHGEDGLDERVLEAFSHDPVLAHRAVEIESEGGAILLHGRVHTAREVQHAVTIARGVPGVAEVRQRLRVRPHR